VTRIAISPAAYVGDQNDGRGWRVSYASGLTLVRSTRRFATTPALGPQHLSTFGAGTFASPGLPSFSRRTL
jgi:hypothetical protein